MKKKTINSTSEKITNTKMIAIALPHQVLIRFPNWDCAAPPLEELPTEGNMLPLKTVVKRAEIKTGA